MGIDYNVYAGPYIEIKVTKLPTHKVEWEFHACPNAMCNSFRKSQNGKFCCNCGTPIRLFKEESDEAWDDLHGMAEELGIDDQVSPDFSEETNGDTQIWYPILDNRMGGSWSVKYENVWEDLTDLDVKVEIRKVEEQCDKALKILEEIYGVKPAIKWGIISSAG